MSVLNVITYPILRFIDIVKEKVIFRIIIFTDWNYTPSDDTDIASWAKDFDYIHPYSYELCVSKKHELVVDGPFDDQIIYQ